MKKVIILALLVVAVSLGQCDNPEFSSTTTQEIGLDNGTVS